MSIPARAYLKIDGLSAASQSGSITSLREIPGFASVCAQWHSVTLNGLTITATRPTSGTCTIVLALVPVEAGISFSAGKVSAVDIAARFMACEIVHFASGDTSTSSTTVTLTLPPRVSHDLNVAQPGEFSPGLFLYCDGGAGYVEFFIRADLTGSGLGYQLPY